MKNILKTTLLSLALVPGLAAADSNIIVVSHGQATVADGTCWIRNASACERDSDTGR